MHMLLAKSSAAVVSANPLHSSVDRKALGKLEFSSVKVFSSGAQALEFLQKSGSQTILVDASLEDMDGPGFIRMLRKQDGLRLAPVVMVTVENRREEVLSAISAGCSGYVLRPYSLATIERHLLMAHESSGFDEMEDEQLSQAQELVRMEQFDEAIEEFEEILQEQNKAQHYFDLGTRCLLEQKYGKAIIAFNKAIKLNELYAEAYKGLADAHKGKGNMEAYEENLKRAADIFALQDRLAEAKDLFVEILKTDPNAVNPYNTLGVRLRKQGDYEGAVHAYHQALQITDDDENLYYNMAKAQLYLEHSQEAAGFLAKALEINPDFHEAAELYRKVAKQPWVPTGTAGAAHAARGNGNGSALEKDD